MNNNAENKQPNIDTKKESERRRYQAPQLVEIDLYSEREVLLVTCKNTAQSFFCTTPAGNGRS